MISSLDIFSLLVYILVYNQQEGKRKLHVFKSHLFFRFSCSYLTVLSKNHGDRLSIPAVVFSCYKGLGMYRTKVNGLVYFSCSSLQS